MYLLATPRKSLEMSASRVRLHELCRMSGDIATSRFLIDPLLFAVHYVLICATSYLVDLTLSLIDLQDFNGF